MNAVRRIGQRTLTICASLGQSAIFLLQLLRQSDVVLRRPRLLIQQLFSVGVMTVVIIVIAGLFVGMVLGLQGYNTLVDFGAETSLGLMVAKLLTRELGPVMTALLFTGRAGSALSAEIGLMKTTEQLAALEMMAVNPMRRVIAPRYLAAIISVPLLAALFNSVGVLGGHLVGVELLGVDSGVYWSAMREGIDIYDDIANGMIKSIVFGAVIAWIALFQGYTCEPNSAGISSATTRTVVAGSLAILGLDYILTAMMFAQ
ncbi:MAG: phospholipid/cholesterol/gamma-HCH transport system permease protein [Parasphingorhabdus sp.]